MDLTELSKNKMLLTGIGEAQVTTMGSFEHKFKIDDENYSLTWHVVPTDKLKFEAVIGSDLLEQASISFTKEGVKFNKYENHAQLMQIFAENLQEELDLRHVENRQIKKELEKLIQDYKPEKTASTEVTMRIIPEDEEPVCQPPRRLAFTERQEVNKQIEEWLNEGIIRPSSAEYASPIVMVKKKDGSSRMCIDYRKLNQKLVKDKSPLPIIEDVLDTLQEAKVYSTLDLRNGFFHVDVDEDCRNYTSFIVPDGQFEFKKVPFELSTSPGVFQLYLSSIFRDLTRKGIIISYLDVVIPAKNEQEGLEKLKIIFEVAKKYGLKIKFKKCQFLKKKIEFLGHIVESGTIKPSPTKALAVRKFPEPTTIKQVQSFLGLTGYFRKYIKDYSKIAKPLSDLTRKENLFVFGTQQKEAFEKLKKIMSEGPILHLYKYGRKTELHTDACKQGFGATLLQEADIGKLHPVYYMSKKTNTAEENISEDYAKKELITRIARWALQLEEFDYEIEHRAGSRMKHVDALSRYPVMMVCNDTLTSKLKKAQEKDDNIQTFKSLLEKQESEEFFEQNGILYKYLNGRELIVTPKAMQAELIKLIHENGHFSVGKTEEIVKQEFFIPNLSNVVKKGSAFTSKLFNDYCDEENIQHLQLATGVPRGNGQVERIHRTLIPVLTKLSLDDSTKWYKYVDRLQRILNSTISRRTKWTPFELLVGIKMRNKEDILIKDLLPEEMANELLEQREFLRNDAKKNIETLQSENRKTYNRRRKKASLYKEGDLVVIQRTQFGAGLKLRPKFLGPYKVRKVNSKDRYEVEKVGQHEGPNSTTTSADLMKHFYA
ncbi:retrovirus-related Pol polyprotein from transposon 17.6 [Trichonephila clavipes]|nr:retrovirus-related Pol polyprotein from transposon 17.6 [Trichonephila clavipes]